MSEQGYGRKTSPLKVLRRAQARCEFYIHFGEIKKGRARTNPALPYRSIILYYRFYYRLRVTHSD